MTDKITVTSGWKARSLVQELKPFRNNSTSGHGPKDASLWGEYQTYPEGDAIYAVYSYRRSWPLYANWKGIWFANEDKFSRTTTKHSSQAHPLTTVVHVSKIDLEYLILFGQPDDSALVKAARLKLLPDELMPLAVKARIGGK
jgi:hypothetical protein